MNAYEIWQKMKRLRCEVGMIGEPQFIISAPCCLQTYDEKRTRRARREGGHGGKINMEEGFGGIQENPRESLNLDPFFSVYLFSNVCLLLRA